MPNYRGHLYGAAFFYGVVLVSLCLWYMSAINIVVWFICTLLGGLFPDIDTKSKGQAIFYKLICVIIIVCLYYRSYYVASMISLFSFSPLLVKHRGLFHRLWFLAGIVTSGAYALTCILPAYTNAIIACTGFFSLGIISHLWLDLGVRGMFRFR